MANEKRKLNPIILARMEARARIVGAVVGKAVQDASIPGRMGFALFLFSFDGEEMTYISNAERATMVQALEEFIISAKTGRVSDPGELSGGRQN